MNRCCSIRACPRFSRRATFTATRESPAFTEAKSQLTGCPFCEGDTQRLGVVQIEGESGLRIDYCETCRGYLKTYDGQGDEALLLADWTSLHLDVIAHDRGLKRLATSLYEIEPVLRA